MTNILHNENGYWIQENRLNNLMESPSFFDRNLATMEQRNNHNSTLNTSNQHETNGETNKLFKNDSIASSNESEDEEKINQSVPYTYTGHLGTTSPQVLKHIDEAIDQVVKHFHIGKNDQMIESSLLASNSSFNQSSQANNSRATKSKKVKRKKMNYAYDINRSLELDAPLVTKKNTDKKKRDTFIGPFIRVEKKRNQTNYIVVNSSSKLEDRDNKFLNKLNYGSIAKSKSSSQILYKQNDNTWICVFCKRQPHYKQLGDLFGPHELIGADKSLANNASLNDSPSTSNHNNNMIANEIWFHEDCIIWSNGIYLVGNRVRNIDEVVIECSDITCCECKLKGANLGCVHKGCNQTFHFICAKERGCELDEENFSMFCQYHKKSNDSSTN